MSYLDIMKQRRSIYNLNASPKLSKEEINKIITDCVKYTPAAFDMSTTKIIVCYGETHHKVWEIAKAAMKKTLFKLRPEAYELVEEKLASFQKGLGTIIFLEDTSMVADLKETYAMYADSFDNWAQQANGMLQYTIWTALASEGVGATLQHYNPAFDEELSKELGISKEQKIIAQMVFGGIDAPAEPREVDYLEENIEFKE